MDVQKRVAICLCGAALGLTAEFAHMTHAVYCPAYRADVIVCGKRVEAIVPEHVHGADVTTPTPQFSRGGTAVTSTGNPTGHRVV